MLDAGQIELDAQAAVHALADRWVIVNGAEKVRALFRRDYVSALGVETGRPNVTVADLDYPSPAQDDVIDLEDGTRYHVRGVQPDGAGATVLLLERQP
jgi:hypothetical protein